MSDNKIPLLGELKSAITGGFVTDINQIRGGSDLAQNALRSVEFDKAKNKLYFMSADRIIEIDVSSFVNSGMLKGVVLDENVLTMTFNLPDGEQNVEIPLESLFSPENYYTKEGVDEQIRNLRMSSILPFETVDYNADNSVFHNGVFHNGVVVPKQHKDGQIVWFKGHTTFYSYLNEEGQDHYYLLPQDIYEKYNDTKTTIPIAPAYTNKVYMRDSILYYFDTSIGNLVQLTMDTIKSYVQQVCEQKVADSMLDATDQINARLNSLEEAAFPVTLSLTATASPNSNFDGSAKTFTITLTVMKDGAAFTPDRVEIKHNSVTVFSAESPDSNKVSFRYTTSEYSNKFTATVFYNGNTKQKETSVTKYLYYPLYVGFAKRDATFEDMTGDSSNFYKTYSSAFSANGITLTNTCESSDTSIFVLLPSGKTLKEFKYGTMGLVANFDKLESEETLTIGEKQLSYNIYRSTSTGITKDTVFDLIKISIQ